jgi:hypothetical protein
LDESANLIPRLRDSVPTELCVSPGKIVRSTTLIRLSAQEQSAAPAVVAPRELVRHTLTGPLAAFDALLIELHPPMGETFFEEVGALHSTFGSVEGAPAQVIVFMVVPKGTNGAAPRA